MALNEKRDIHENVECDLKACSRISFYDKNMKIRGLMYAHFPLIGLARGAMRNSAFRKEFPSCRS